MFALNYAQARTQFLNAAHLAGAAVHSDVHPLTGCEGEVLALDIAVLGDASAPKRVLLSSGVHGVEGFCGSGIQIAALRDAPLLATAKAAGIAIICAHAVNPHGFSFRRRATHENVDLNRNFQDFANPLPYNADYHLVSPLLFPDTWPPNAANQAAVGALIASKGMVWLQQAISGGQYHDEKGIFYGGIAPTWSNAALRRVLNTHCASAKRLAWIDLHTGLGPAGHGERMYGYSAGTASDRAGFERASRWWGNDGKTPLTTIQDGNSVSAALTGTVAQVGYQECPHSELTKMTIEYGTAAPLAVLQAMRGDQWNQLHPQAPASLRESNSQAMMNAFFVNTPQWQAQVLEQGLQAVHQAVAGLGQA